MNQPTTPIHDPSFQYIKSELTDVQKTFAKHGWTPPDRTRQEQVRVELNPYIYERV